MRTELKNKLILAIQNGATDEPNVVYVLSRIRKIFELDPALRKQHKVLNVYCNWSLHASIDRTEDVKEILEEFIEKAELRHHFVYLEAFKSDFIIFAKNTLTIDLNEDYLDRFGKSLIEIIADTPISYIESRKTTIVINPSELPRRSDQITYKIIPET